MNSNIVLKEALDFANLDETIKLDGFIIDINELVFEKRMAMNCFYCGKYGQNWRCPPKLPQIDYKAMFAEFDKGAMVHVKVPFDNDNYEQIRTNSSIILHKGLLKIEKYLWNHNNSTYLSFIAGACKLCKNGCGENRCNNPYLSRSPIEATGINVVKTAAKYGFDITFPPKEYIIRCGLIVW